MVAVALAKRKATPCARRMIKRFQHKGLERFLKTGAKSVIEPHHAQKLRLRLTALNIAEAPGEMNIPGWRHHALSGDLSGFYSVAVNGNCPQDRARLLVTLARPARFVGSQAEATAKNCTVQTCGLNRQMQRDAEWDGSSLGLILQCMTRPESRSPRERKCDKA